MHSVIVRSHHLIGTIHSQHEKADNSAPQSSPWTVAMRQKGRYLQQMQTQA